MDRKAVTSEAISWVGTPYHSHARIKGVGVDCAMLPAAVYEAVGLIDRVDPQYTQDWMMHKDEEQFISYITPWADEIDAASAKPGDLVVWKFGRVYSHSAIIIEWPLVVHAAVRGRAVVMADAENDFDLKGRPARFFHIEGVD